MLQSPNPGVPNEGECVPGRARRTRNPPDEFWQGTAFGVIGESTEKT